MSEGSGPWGIKVLLNGMWREVAHVEGTPREIHNLTKVIRLLGDEVHADAATEQQAQTARRRFESAMQSAADNRCGTCHRDAHRPGMENSGHHGHEYRAPEAG